MPRSIEAALQNFENKLESWLLHIEENSGKLHSKQILDFVTSSIKKFPADQTVSRKLKVLAEKIKKIDTPKAQSIAEKIHNKLVKHKMLEQPEVPSEIIANVMNFVDAKTLNQLTLVSQGTKVHADFEQLTRFVADMQEEVPLAEKFENTSSFLAFLEKNSSSRQLQQIKSLNFSQFRGLNDEQFGKILHYFPNLENLEIHDYYPIRDKEHPITDKGLQFVKDLKSLRDLNISSCKDITPSGLTILRHLPALEYLNLSECRKAATDIGIANVTGLSSLKSLHLAGCLQITDVGLEHIKSCPGLVDLNLEDLQFSDQGIASVLSVTTHLETLNLKGHNFTSQPGPQSIVNLSALKDLTIELKQDTRFSLDDLATTSLKSLTIQCEIVTNTILQSLARMHALEKLKFLRAELGNPDEDFKIPAIKFLTSLSFIDCSFEDRQIQDIFKYVNATQSIKSLEFVRYDFIHNRYEQPLDRASINRFLSIPHLESFIVNNVDL